MYLASYDSLPSNWMCQYGLLAVSDARASKQEGTYRTYMQKRLTAATAFLAVSSIGEHVDPEHRERTLAFPHTHSHRSWKMRIELAAQRECACFRRFAGYRSQNTFEFAARANWRPTTCRSPEWHLICSLSVHGFSQEWCSLSFGLWLHFENMTSLGWSATVNPSYPS